MRRIHAESNLKIAEVNLRTYAVQALTNCVSSEAGQAVVRKAGKETVKKAVNRAADGLVLIESAKPSTSKIHLRCAEDWLFDNMFRLSSRESIHTQS